jgi:protein-L-isoaspartate(D-aspartate) O-methyltransferase
MASFDRQDTFKHKGHRKKLIEELRAKGIIDENVLGAMERLPRHFFLDPAFEHYAYEDRAFTISANQTISQPYTVAFQSSLLEVKKFDKILEVGTGSGYQACVLAEMGAQVYTIERQKVLFDELTRHGYITKYSLIKRIYGDGYKGLPTFAPFDKIIITAAAPDIPEALLQQLKIGGIMVVPVGDVEGVQQMCRIKRLDEQNFEKTFLGEFKFVPMLEGRNN